MSVGSPKVWRNQQRTSVPGTRIIPAAGVFTQKLLPRPGNIGLKDLGQVFDVATGIHAHKVIIAPDNQSVFFLASGLSLKYLNSLDGRFSFGAATGGTWEPSRFVFGMPEFCREHFNGLSFPIGQMETGAPLDDYDYTRASYLRLLSRLGPEEKFIAAGRLPWTYYGEHRVWLDRLGFDKNAFISPNFGLEKYSINGDPRELLDGDFNMAARNFNEALNTRVRPTAQQCYGIGTRTGHLGFNENGIDDGAFTEQERTDILLKQWTTRGIRLHDITLLQNGSAFFPLGLSAGEQKIYDATSMFRNIGGTFGLISFEDIFAKARFLILGENKPRELDYVSDAQWKFFVENLDDIQERAVTVTQAIMPANGITQGTADLRSYDGKNWTSGFDLILGIGGWKRSVVKAAIEGPLTPKCAASAMRTFYNAVFIVSEDAARDLSAQARRECFVFKPDQATASTIQHFTADNISRLFWGK